MTDDALGNSAYYRQREESERDLAERAPTNAIRQIHLQLSRRYAQLADEFQAGERAGYFVDR